jgi:hypothetical protein
LAVLSFQEIIPGCVRASEFAPYYLVFEDGSRRAATDQEVNAVADAIKAEQTKRIESDTARDDAKRALSALDMIITGIDGATLAQAKAAIKQLAQIQRHHILATLGR